MSLPYGANRVSASESDKTSIFHPKTCRILGQNKTNIKCGKLFVGYSTINWITNYTTTGNYCKSINCSAWWRVMSPTAHVVPFSNLLATVFNQNPIHKTHWLWDDGTGSAKTLTNARAWALEAPPSSPGATALSHLKQHTQIQRFLAHTLKVAILTSYKKLSVWYFELKLHIYALVTSETYFTSCKKGHNRSPLRMLCKVNRVHFDFMWTSRNVGLTML